MINVCVRVVLWHLYYYVRIVIYFSKRTRPLV